MTKPVKKISSWFQKGACRPLPPFPPAEMEPASWEWVGLFEPKEPPPPPPPEVAAQRAKAAAKRKEQRAAGKQRALALAHGLPPPPRPKIGRPRKKRAVEDTVLGSKRKAKSKAWHSLVLVDYAVLLEKAAAEEEAAAEEAAAEEAAAEEAAAEEAAAEEAAAEEAAAEEAAAVIAEAVIEQAAAELVAAEIEAAIEVEAQKAAARAVAEQVATERAAAKTAAKRAAKQRKEAKLLAPDTGYVETAPLIPLLAVRSEAKCLICLEDGADDSNWPDSSMPCCGAHVHLACVMKWHALAQQGPTVTGPNRHQGTVPIRIENCRACVACRVPLVTARGPPRHRPFEG